MSVDDQNIVYRIAVPSECERIREALISFYYPEELLNVSYIDENGHSPTGPTEQDIQYALSFVTQGMAAIAIDSKHGIIVGVSIARLVDLNTAEELLGSVVSPDVSRKRAEMVKLFAYLERTGDVCGRFRTRRSYHVFVLAVDPRFRRRAIGQKLMEFQLARGKTLRFRLVSADFSNEQASRIGARLDMRCVAALALDQYRNSSGERVFEARGADNIVCTYARYV
ncbi:AGAP006788-PA-like protein [Anopheles sinensis]|uniref:AGAP006788-PA-like protein n=1 Tax=Anopheles sinensis TaxID=74873 RepID=A0A084WMY9_ANOSI|nr:AGAP006788-PA-like protein [Anopheles sinensis]